MENERLRYQYNIKIIKIVCIDKAISIKLEIKF